MFNFSQNLHFGRISVDDGLSNSSVNCLIQDHTGFIWCGTDDGLNRFDGYEIKVYRNNPEDSLSLSDNIIWSLFEDHLGFLWIGTKNGNLNRYNPYKDKFEHWNLGSDGTEENSITSIFEDKNDFIWIGTYKNGLYRLDQSKNKFNHWQNNINGPKVLSDNFITFILEDDYGNIWIATYNGLNKYNPDQPDNPFSQINTEAEYQKSAQNNPIWFLRKSSIFNKSILIGKLNGLIKFDPITGESIKIELPQSKELQFGNSVSSIAEENTTGGKILWVGTFGGLVRINFTNDEEDRFIHNEKRLDWILSNQVNEVILDKSGVIWIATDNGLNFYSPKSSKFNSYLTKNFIYQKYSELLNKNIRAVARSYDGSLWFGTDRGLIGIKNINGNFSTYNNPELQSLDIWSLLGGSSNKLWIGTYGQGLKELDTKFNKIRSWKIANPAFNISAYNYIKTIIEDDKKMIWIGFWGGGLARLNPTNEKVEYWRNEPDNPSSLSYNDVWTLYQDSRGRIWIGTNGGGLDLFNEKLQNKFIHWQTNKNNKQSLSSDNIYSICESINGNHSSDQTILWIGTGNGLNKFVIQEDSTVNNNLKVKINYYTISNGLPDNSIESILEDENGNLWIGTSSGISFFDVQDETFTNYNLSDGLAGNTFNSCSAAKTKDGVMLFGSTAGLNYFDPKQIKQSSYSPSVIITDFQIFNRPVNISEESPLKTAITSSKEIKLDYNQNVFSFQFSALDYNSPRSIRYLYKMDGFDKDWIYCGSRRFATYTNLDPGVYTFKIKATNADGVWNGSEKTISVIIKPPFWMSWWFRTIIILAFLSIGPLIYYRRVAQLKKEQKVQVEFSKQLIHSQEEERKRIASELHDSLGQDLLVIKNLALMNKNKDEQFDVISKTAGIAIDEVRRIAYNLHPYQLDRLGLTKAISSMFTNLEGISKVKFDVQIENVDNLFDKEKKINIYRIVQECVTNILKHSGADKAVVKVLKPEEKLLIEIADNGKGFDYEAAKSESKGFGLKNLEKRVSFLEGEIEFQSSQEFATVINIKVPISK